LYRFHGFLANFPVPSPLHFITRDVLVTVAFKPFPTVVFVICITLNHLIVSSFYASHESCAWWVNADGYDSTPSKLHGNMMSAYLALHSSNSWPDPLKYINHTGFKSSTVEDVHVVICHSNSKHRALIASYCSFSTYSNNIKSFTDFFYRSLAISRGRLLPAEETDKLCHRCTLLLSRLK
jgi:hypothetical protein